MAALTPDIVPSFFPTPREVAGGIRWIRDHPVVATAAAAAATAVSVITFLKSTSVDSDDEAEIDDQATDDSVLPPVRDRFLTWNDKYHATEEELRMLNCSPRRSKSSEQLRTRLPTKMANESEDICSNTDSEFSSLVGPSRRVTSMLSLSDAEPDFSLREEFQVPCSLERCSKRIVEEDDDPSTSPQWGWYVSTTPPDEYYA